jgi:hypothetical protein
MDSNQPIIRVVTLIGALAVLGPRAAEAQNNWWTVVSIEPGREITLVTDTRPASLAVFVRADDSALTILSLDRAAIADGVKRLLRASFTPEALAAAREGKESMAGGVSLGPRGLLVGGQRVADLSEVIAEVPRRAVHEVGRPGGKANRRAWGTVLIVLGAGMTVGNLVGLSAASDPDEYGEGYIGVAGVAIGTSLAVLGGFLIKQSRAPTIIYRR